MNLLTVPETAARLRVSKAKVYQLAKNNHIPVVRLGASVRIPLEALESFLLSQIIPATAVGESGSGAGDGEPNGAQ